MVDFAGSHVVVTGGTGALGRAVVGALRAADAVCHVPNLIAAELDRIVHEPQIEKRFAEIGGEAVGGPPSTLASLIHDEIARWRRVAKEAGIHIE